MPPRLATYALCGFAFAATTAAFVAPARAQDAPSEGVHQAPIAKAALLFDGAVGPARYATISSAFGLGGGVHARYAFIQAGIGGMFASGSDGKVTASVFELGPVLRDVGGLDIGLLAIGGRRTYIDVGGVAKDGGFFNSCSGVSGFDGSTTYLGARLDVQRSVREGPAGLLGASLYYSRDLTSQQLSKDGAVVCNNTFGGGTSGSPRHIDATMGGYEIGVVLRFGMSVGL